MDTTRQDEHEFSSWFTKAQPSQADEAEERAVPAEESGGPSATAAQASGPSGEASGDPAAQTTDI
jgi:hypothetical protein